MDNHSVFPPAVIWVWHEESGIRAQLLNREGKFVKFKHDSVWHERHSCEKHPKKTTKTPACFIQFLVHFNVVPLRMYQVTN